MAQDVNAETMKSEAENGGALAQFALGIAYANGLYGLPQDYGMATMWYERAAEQGISVAAYAAGVAYAKGQGVTQDYVRAHMWLTLAAWGMPPIPGSEDTIKDIMEIKDGIEEQMTSSQIAEADHLSRARVYRISRKLLERHPEWYRMLGLSDDDLTK